MELTGLVATALDALAPTHNTVSEEHLRNAYQLIGLDDLLAQDAQDPYFNAHQDALRQPIPAVSLDDDHEAHLELVPLVSRTYHLDQRLVDDYLARQRAHGHVAAALSRWPEVLDVEQDLGLRFHDRVIGIKKGKDGRKVKKGQEQPISLDPARASLDGYMLRTKFGIGKVEADLVVPDAPFALELYDSREHLGLTIGFWYQHDPSASGKNQHKMIVAQMQQPRDAHIPGEDQGAQMGIVGLEIAQLVAKHIGMGIVQTYSAETHPLFVQHPDRKERLKGPFVCLYDSSAKALGFTGTRSTHYTKQVG